MTYIELEYRDEEYVCRDELISDIADSGRIQGTIGIWNGLTNTEELNKLFNPHGVYIETNEVKFNDPTYPMLSLALFLCAREETVAYINRKGIDNDLYKLIIKDCFHLFSRDSYDYAFMNGFYTAFGLFLLREKGFEFKDNSESGISSSLGYHAEFNVIKDYLMEFLELMNDTINYESLESVRCTVNKNFSTLGRELSLVDNRVNSLVKEWENA